MVDPVSVVLGAAPKALDAALKLAGAWRSHQDAREAELRLLRVLYFEVCHNLGVLERFRITDRGGVASNDRAYLGVAKLLDVDAHLAMVLVRGETEEERDAVRRERERMDLLREQSAAERERAILREAVRQARLDGCRAVWGDLWDESWELGEGYSVDADSEAEPDAAPDSEIARPPAANAGAKAAEPARPTQGAPSKVTTLLRSLAFVSVKVPTLKTLAEVDDATRAVMRDLRVAVRLEQIRQHESALQRRLEELPGVASVRVHV